MSSKTSKRSQTANIFLKPCPDQSETPSKPNFILRIHGPTYLDHKKNREEDFKMITQEQQNLPKNI